MTEFEFLRHKTEGPIATLWLARPPVNAASQVMYREIAALFGDIGQLGHGVKVVVLAAEGAHFCAGNDLLEFATLDPGNAADRMAEVRAAFFAIQDCRLPVIGAVQGSALGSGLAIAASCDFVVASDDAIFGTPEVGVGIMGGARHLARLVPEPLMRWMYFTADAVPAQRLAEVGGLIEVVPRADLLACAYRHAARVARHGVVLLETAKESLNGFEGMDLQAGYTFEQGLTVRVCGHPDSREAMRATLERRPAVYPSQRPVSATNGR
jgi:enoyl-CoA hydratase